MRRASRRGARRVDRPGDGHRRSHVHDRASWWTAAEARFLRSLRSPTYAIEAPSAEDLLRASELVEEYADLPLGGTAAAVVALAERLGETTLATLDRRHFSVVRPRHADSFELRP